MVIKPSRSDPLSEGRRTHRGLKRENWACTRRLYSPKHLTFQRRRQWTERPINRFEKQMANFCVTDCSNAFDTCIPYSSTIRLDQSGALRRSHFMGGEGDYGHTHLIELQGLSPPPYVTSLTRAGEGRRKTSMSGRLHSIVAVSRCETGLGSNAFHSLKGAP